MKILPKCSKIVSEKEMRKIDWLDFEITEKVYKRILIIGIAIIICYLGVMLLSFAVPRVYNMDKDTVIVQDGSVKIGINSVYRGSLRLKLSGWAYKEGQDVKIFDSSYVLTNTETGQMYLIKAEKAQVPQLQNVDEKYDCSNCGLEAQSIVFGLKNGTYDIYILYQNDNENLLVNTGIQANI